MEILRIPLVIIFETITQWFFRLCRLSEDCAGLQACYHLINPNCRWLIVILNWFFVLYPKIAAIMKKIFLAFLTHPMLIANFFPFGFFPVELNSGLTAISNRIHCIPVRLSIFRWLHVTYIHMEGLGYHKGHHWSSTEVAPTLNDLPLEWVWNNTFFNGKTCWPLHRWSMTPVGLRFKTRVTSLSTPNGRPVRAWRLWRASGKPWEGRLQPGRQGVDGQKGVKFQPILEEHLKQPNLGGW